VVAHEPEAPRAVTATLLRALGLAWVSPAPPPACTLCSGFTEWIARGDGGAGTATLPAFIPAAGCRVVFTGGLGANVAVRRRRAAGGRLRAPNLTEDPGTRSIELEKRACR